MIIAVSLCAGIPVWVVVALYLVLLLPPEIKVLVLLIILLSIAFAGVVICFWICMACCNACLEQKSLNKSRDH